MNLLRRYGGVTVGSYLPKHLYTDTDRRDVQVIGIRSKTKLTARVLREAKNLIVIGCFCIGTNQVDLGYAAEHGIAVFNSPFSNSRSVAELVIAEIIALARQLGDSPTSSTREHGTKSVPVAGKYVVKH